MRPEFTPDIVQRVVPFDITLEKETLFLSTAFLIWMVRTHVTSDTVLMEFYVAWASATMGTIFAAVGAYEFAHQRNTRNHKSKFWAVNTFLIGMGLLTISAITMI